MINIVNFLVEYLHDNLVYSVIIHAIRKLYSYSVANYFSCINSIFIYFVANYFS